MSIAVLYGIKENRIDVTDICLKRLTTEHIITIPSGDYNRSFYFKDHLYKIPKKIFVILNGDESEFDYSYVVRIHITDATIRTSTKFPINFSIPREKIHDTYNVKTKLMSDLVPGDVRTYIYKTEEEYYNEYNRSYFAITKMKGGWDCMRHYEILANGCIPYFMDIDKCPPTTLSLLPKNLFIEGNKLYDKLKASMDKLTEAEISEYNILRSKLLEHTKEHLTTDKVAEYVLRNTNSGDAKKILYLSGNTGPDYLRCATLHGFKILRGSACHDFPKVPHLYKSDSLNYKRLYGKGMSYTNLLDPALHDEALDATLVADIKAKYYDLIIFGSYHRGMPYYDLISKIYSADKIIIFCGEDFHDCDLNKYLNRGHFVFVREL
jgi:hypothetical protein